MHRLIVGICLWLAVWSGVYAGELRLPIEGEIGIDPQGHVFDYRTETKMDAAVAALVERTVRAWRFEPVMRDGAAVAAKANLRMTLVLTPVQGGYQAGFADVHFPGERRERSIVPPTYPSGAMKFGVSSDVLVAVRVDAQGDVLEAAAIQIAWPYGRAGAQAARQWGRLFEQATTTAALKWKFEPADPGGEQETTLVVPVSYRMAGENLPVEGWRNETAGPLRPIPWLDAGRQSFNAIGLRDGESLVVGDSVKLLTSLAGAAQ